MRTKKTFNEKRKAVFNYLLSKDKQSLASLCIALMFKKDIESEYRELPNSYKK